MRECEGEGRRRCGCGEVLVMSKCTGGTRGSGIVLVHMLLLFAMITSAVKVPVARYLNSRSADECGAWDETIGGVCEMCMGLSRAGR